MPSFTNLHAFRLELARLQHLRQIKVPLMGEIQGSKLKRKELQDYFVSRDASENNLWFSKTYAVLIARQFWIAHLTGTVWHFCVSDRAFLDPHFI